VSDDAGARLCRRAERAAITAASLRASKIGRRRLRGLLDQIFRQPKHLVVEGVILVCADDARFGRFIRRVSRRHALVPGDAG
jgi:hypothetical protein